MAWLLLIEVNRPRDFRNEENKFAFAVDHKAHKTAVATRHWYKTATAAAEEPDPGDPVRYYRFPGLGCCLRKPVAPLGGPSPGPALQHTRKHGKASTGPWTAVTKLSQARIRKLPREASYPRQTRQFR